MSRVMRKVNQQSDPWDLREGQIRRQQRRELKNPRRPDLSLQTQVGMYRATRCRYISDAEDRSGSP